MTLSAQHLSFKDIVPIDPDQAGKTVTDYLHDFGQITFFALIGLAVLSLIVAIVVAKKAGYSGWWGAIAVLFPPVGLVLMVLLAALKWPALKERDEALGVLTANDLTLPSHERKAIKEAERKRAIEDAARKRMEKAQADRERADAEHARFAASEAKRAADAATVAAAASAAAAKAASIEPSSIEAAPSEPATIIGDAAETPRTEAPGSVAPKVRTVRPRTTTTETTGSAASDPAAPPEA